MTLFAPTAFSSSAIACTIGSMMLSGVCEMTLRCIPFLAGVFDEPANGCELKSGDEWGLFGRQPDELETDDDAMLLASDGRRFHERED